MKTLANLYENTIHHNSDNTVYLDEVTFSAKTLQNRAWAELGENITQSVFIKSEPCVAILAAATVQRGLFLFHWRPKSFNSDAVCDFLQDLRETIGGYDKISIVLDSCAIHRTHKTL